MSAPSTPWLAAILCTAFAPFAPNGRSGELPVVVDSLEVFVSTTREAYGRGDSIDVALDLTNQSTTPVTLQFASGQRYDFALVDADGETLWRWGADRGFMQMLGTEELGPGESLTFLEEAPPPPEPGRYTIVGWVTAIHQTLTARTTVVVQ